MLAMVTSKSKAKYIYHSFHTNDLRKKQTNKKPQNLQAQTSTYDTYKLRPPYSHCKKWYFELGSLSCCQLHIMRINC